MVWNGDESLIPENRDFCTYDTCPVTESVFGYVPQLGFNIVLLALFSISTVAFVAIGIKTKTWGFLVAMTGGGILEMIGYTARVTAYPNPWSGFGGEAFTIQMTCLTLAPACYCAGIYLCLSRIVIAFGADISRIPPKAYTYIFIICDILSLVIQGAGGGIASAAETSSGAQTGINIMLAGLAWQVFTITLFFVLCGEFAWRCVKNKDRYGPENAKLRRSLMFKGFLFALGFATLLIYVRCIYRLIEMSEGWRGPLMVNEKFFLILEGLMVVLAVLALNIFHPGICFGQSFASRTKARRAKYDEEGSSMEQIELNRN